MAVFPSKKPRISANGQAVGQNGLALQHASEELQTDAELLKEAGSCGETLDDFATMTGYS